MRGSSSTLQRWSNTLLKLWLVKSAKSQSPSDRRVFFFPLELFFISKTDVRHVLIFDRVFLQSSWGPKGAALRPGHLVSRWINTKVLEFSQGETRGPHADPVYVFGSGFVLSLRCKTPSPWDKRWLMPLNERHFNGPRLLKRFIRLSADLSTHSAHGSPSQQNRKAGEGSFEVLVTVPSHKTLGIEIWLALTDFWLHTTLRPLQVWIPYKYHGGQATGHSGSGSWADDSDSKHGRTASVPSPRAHM